MISAERVRDIIASGISRFQKPYDIAASRIQLVFYIKDECVMYVSCIDGVVKNTVQLKDIIGVNIYNSMVAGHIKKMITTLAAKTGSEVSAINLFADLDALGKVHVWLREAKVIIRELTDTELSA